MTVHVALLRGINVGGKNRLPMQGLSALFTDAGCTDVRTYVQSGNVIFRATPNLAVRIPAVIEKAISDRPTSSRSAVARSTCGFRTVWRDPSSPTRPSAPAWGRPARCATGEPSSSSPS